MALFLAMDCVMKLLDMPFVRTASVQIGYPVALDRPIGIIELVCLALYVTPRTAILGAILTTGLLGGAVAALFRLSDPLFSHVLFGVYVGVMAWGGLRFREPRPARARSRWSASVAFMARSRRPRQEAPMTRTRLAFAASAVVLLGAAASAVAAQTPAVASEPGAAQLAIHTLPAKSGKTLRVTSPAFKTGGDIPLENTSWRANIFPGLSWGKGPYGTRTFAIIMQDDDAIYKGAPILHWTMYDIPGGTLTLAAGMTTPPAGSSYGPNIAGPAHAYMGPHTPPGPKHHYHLQVFALDETIAPAPIKTYADLTAAMSGHVLASGELVGLGHADPNAPPRPAPPPSSAPTSAAPPAH